MRFYGVGDYSIGVHIYFHNTTRIDYECLGYLGGENQFLINLCFWVGDLTHIEFIQIHPYNRNRMVACLKKKRMPSYPEEELPDSMLSIHIYQK